MNLVDEEDVARLQGGEDGGEVAGVLDGGAGRHVDVGAYLRRDDQAERGLAQPRWAIEQHVIQRLVALERGLEEDAQIGLHDILADVLVQASRAKTRLLPVVFARLRRDDAVGHAVASTLQCDREHVFNPTDLTQYIIGLRRA